MAQRWNNNAISTLSAGISTSDTTIFVQPGHGGRYPTIVAPDFCFCTLEDASGNIEIVKVTAHAAAAAAFTVVRAQQGTAAVAYIIGDLFEQRLTATEATAWEADIDNLELTRARKAGDTYTGTHDFSGATAVALPANTSIGSVSATEISYIDGLTSNAQAQINSKGNIAGQTWSGTHAFPATMSVGPVTGIEIGYLAGVTSSIQGQLNLKASLAGAIYTGTHDFTGGTVTGRTAPTNTNTTELATTQFVQQVAFASLANLPADPGDAIPRALITTATIKAWLPLSNDLAQYAAGII